LNPTRRALLVMLALAAPVCAQDVTARKETPASGGARRIKVDEEVRLFVKDGAIHVEPHDALVELGGTLDWKAGNLPAGSELEIDFMSAYNKVGPFAWRAPSAHSPRRGRYVLGPNQKHSTLKAEAVGYWKYQVIVRLPDGSELSIDPGVIIKEGG
jgi:hypothetical protein